VSRLLIASLDRFGPLRDGVRERLAACDQKAETFEPGQVIFAAGARSKLRLLARGLAIKVAVLPEGGRQIFAVAVPGDLIDLAGLFVGCDHEVRALGPCEVRSLSSGDVRALLQDHPSLVAALCRAVLTEARIQRNWMVSLGRRSAAARTANLLCEVYWRQKALALAGDGRCALPAVQSDIADALGLSKAWPPCETGRCTSRIGNAWPPWARSTPMSCGRNAIRKAPVASIARWRARPPRRDDQLIVAADQKAPR
jgi:CRP-like cAMP-binding protein